MTDAEKQAIRQSRLALEQALKEAGSDYQRGNVVRCPWHADKHPSGSVYLSPDGAWKFACHKCKICEDVIGVLARSGGKASGEVLKELTDPEPPKPKTRAYASLEAIRSGVYGIESDYVYRNPATQRPELVVVRQKLPDGGKKFIQFRPLGNGFESGAPPKPWPIYNRTRIAKSDAVIVVEGEKCVHALADIGIVASTSPCGAGKAEHADWSPLAGKHVYLWPDNDDVGIQHMRDVAKILQKIEPAPELFWIDPADLDLAPKGDVVDYLAPYAGLTKAERQTSISLVLSSVAKAIGGAASDLGSFIEDMIAGKWQAISWPWDLIGRLTQSLLPGTVTCICGDPGCGKSFLALEAGWWWHSNNVKVAIYELEDDRRYHLQRALAQLCDKSDLTDAIWVQDNPDETRRHFGHHRKTIESFGRTIWEAPDKPPRIEELTEWVEKQAASGCRIIVIDPITAAAANDKPWVSDQQFVMRAKAAARKYGCSVVLVTHPRMGKTNKPLDGLAGGASFSRFSQTVLWIDKHDEPLAVRIKRPGQIETSATINRSVRISKARNGRGAGLEIGFVFRGDSLRFSEQGIVTGIVEEKRARN